ncbi:MAG: membrane protein insertion efficiency factor YidD [Acidobacteriota bacterium]
MRRRFLIVLICGIAAWALFADISRQAHEQVSCRLLIGGIHIYQGVFSGAFERMGIECRFEPTCSRYAETSLKNLGLMAGATASIKRLLRCGPWTPRGTLDPPPVGTVASEAMSPYAPPPAGAGRDR